MLRDHLSGKRMIYLLNVQTFFENQFLKMQELRFSLEKKSAMWRRFESFFGTGISFVFKMGIGFYLANSLMTGQLTAGQGAFLVLILPKLHSYFLQLSGVFRDVKMMEDGAVRLFEILKTKEKQELKTVFEFRSLVFKNVFFSRDGKEVIHDLSFEIQRGEKVVFYGPSGCGKTTVWLLMLGLLKPIAGEILLNGEPLETMDLKSWYGLLSIVPQENELFRLSWDDNLRLGRKEKWVWNPDFFPLQGLREETSAVYRGEVATFSKGEMRRLVVARALLNNAPVLLLDEPDAHWDEALADKISRFFFGFSEKTAEKTLFLFTHRPSWIQKAEKRIFLGALV
jgi:ABC-type multidrug transport system fused ATPase/permease subunit